MAARALLVKEAMYETPQSFASKAAIIEVLKRADGTPLTRGELIDAVSRELERRTEETEADVTRAIDEMKLEEQIWSEVVDGVEKLHFGDAAH